MVSITLTNNMDRKTLLVDAEKTIREVLDENNVDYSTATPALDGTPLRAGEMDKSLASYGITESCRLSCIAKTSNA